MIQLLQKSTATSISFLLSPVGLGWRQDSRVQHDLGVTNVGCSGPKEQWETMQKNTRAALGVYWF